MKTFKLIFVPHLPPVEFEVKARSKESAVRKAEKQISRGRGPVFEQIRERLREEVLNYARADGKPRLAPCPCRSTQKVGP